MSRPGGAGGSERGAATVLAVALLGLLVLVAYALSVVAAVLVAHRTAQSAADLAALAGAGAVAGPTGDEPCEAAKAVSEANGARLEQCVVTGRDVLVMVAVPGPEWRGWRAGDLRAQSRAGPGLG